MQEQEFPTDADLPAQILVLSAADAMPLVLGFGVGIFTEAIVTCILLGCVSAFAYRKFQERRPRGWIWHWAYWHGIIPQPKNLPNPFSRRTYP